VQNGSTILVKKIVEENSIIILECEVKWSMKSVY
jgi:hypothetical protein